MKKLTTVASLFIGGVLFASSAFAWTSTFPTGVVLYDPAKAQNGYVLISEDSGHDFAKINDVFPEFKAPVDYNSGRLPKTKLSQRVYLIDMNGNIVNEWKEPSSNKKVTLLPNGNILSMSMQPKEVVEYDWDGNVVWRYKTNLGPHHSMTRLDNGNTLILCFEEIPSSKTKKIKNLTTPWFGEQKRKGMELTGDTIIEVNPEGQIVWYWESSEHMDFNNYNPTKDSKDWTHGNTASVIPENKWYDAGDKRFKPGNIIFNPRHFNQFFVIDKDTKKVVWESPKDFNQSGGLANPHEPYMIPKGYPGEGNIMIFDNGLTSRLWTHETKSIIYEFRPDTFEVVWRYTDTSQKFQSKVKGSAYKLKNGNVLISEDVPGKALQIRPDANFPNGGEIVWEYQATTSLARTSMYDYDFTPQLAKLKKPKQDKVSAVHPVGLKVLPDSQRKNGVVMQYTAPK